MSNPKVSVVMGVFNGERHLEKSLNSILDQTFHDFEFIIINDGSTDQTKTILDQYLLKDSRLYVIHQNNQGLTKSLVTGCKLARGKYIARQDADDYSFPERFRLQVDYLEQKNEVVLVSSWGNITGPKDEILSQEKRPSDINKATKLFASAMVGPPGHGSVMFRKCAYETVGGYRPVFYFVQDNDLWLRLIQEGKLGYIPKVLYSFQISPDSISGGLHGAKLAYVELVDQCFQLRKEGKPDSEAIQAFVDRQANQGGLDRISFLQKKKSSFRTNYFIGRCLIKRKDRRAFSYFLQSLLDYPISILAWGNLLVSIWYLARNKLPEEMEIVGDQ